MAPPSITKTTFTCCVCQEDHQEVEPVKIQGDFLCKQCFDDGIKPQFFRAAANEADYPVRWGGKAVDIAPLRHHFDRAFLKAWTYKTKEYSTPGNERLYCAGTASSQPCGAFLGPQAKHRSTKKCGICQYYTCVDCKASFGSNPLNHTCSEPAQATDPFDDLERGKEYQKCPGCNTPVELQDGCNHITCQMGNYDTHFCFLCGAQATHEDGHWAVGKPCPLYNRPGEANAQYDAVQDEDEDEMLHVEATLDLIEEAIADLDANNDTDTDSPEVKLRRSDRRWIVALSRTLSDEHEEAVAAGQEPHAGTQAVMSLLKSLKKMVGHYTIHLEQDEIMRDVKQEILNAVTAASAAQLTAIPEVDYTRYQRLRLVVVTVTAATRGEDMAAIAAARLAEF